MTLELHPWGHFKPGAWKLYRVVTETFDEHGAVVNTSVTYSKTTLKSAEERNCVALEIEAVVEVAGKTLDTAPKMVKQGLHGTSPEEAGNVKKLPTAELVIEGRKIPCEVEQVESSDSSGRTITKTWYSQAVAPYVLRPEQDDRPRRQDRHGRNGPGGYFTSSPLRVAAAGRATALG